MNSSEVYWTGSFVVDDLYACVYAFSVISVLIFSTISCASASMFSLSHVVSSGIFWWVLFLHECYVIWRDRGGIVGKFVRGKEVTGF